MLLQQRGTPLWTAALTCLRSTPDCRPFRNTWGTWTRDTESNNVSCCCGGSFKDVGFRCCLLYKGQNCNFLVEPQTCGKNCDNVLDQVFCCYFFYLNYKVSIPWREDPSKGFLLNFTKPTQRRCHCYLSPSVLHWCFHLFIFNDFDIGWWSTKWRLVCLSICTFLAETRWVSVFSFFTIHVWYLSYISS